MPSLIQKHAHVKGQRSNHHIFKFQPNPSWAKKRPNRYTSFHIWIASIKLSFKFKYGLCSINGNQDGLQTGLSVCTFGHSHLLPNGFHSSYMVYFYQTLGQVRIWALSDNQDCCQNGCHLSVCTCAKFIQISFGLLSSNYSSCLNMGFIG